MNKILLFLEQLYPNPKCELHYSNDYQLLIAIVLSAQSTDKGVNVVTEKLFNKYKTIEQLNNADIKDIENIIRPVGTYKRKSLYIKDIAKKIVENNGKVPTDRVELEKIGGVGRKTINVFLAEYYNEPCIAVDTHVERVSKRLGLVSPSATPWEIEQKLMKLIAKDKWAKTHLQLVLFGRYFCKSRNPRCYDCKLQDICLKYKK